MINLKEDHSKFVKLSFFSKGATSPTNIKLAEEMISYLDEEIFKNPNSKFLDPCAGTGTFGVVLYDRLLKYHDSKWILENMIFMVDISRVNYDILKKLGFVNVYNENFLNLKLNMEFDVVLGNPPFQSSGVQLGQSHLYPHFITKGIELIKSNGKLMYVNPPTFLKDKIHCMDGAFIEYFNTTAKKYFNVGSTFCWYIMSKNNSNTHTLVKTDTEEFYANIKYDGSTLIPLGNMSNISLNIIQKIYGITSTSNFTFKRDVAPVPKDSVFVRRMNRNKYFNALIVNDLFDIKLNADYTDTIRSYEKQILLNSKLFSFLYICYSTSPFITLGFINNIPMPSSPIKDSDDFIYNLYDLTQEEIDYIENYVG
jgi:16S rRNA G966 N2-methylase RsmD